MNALTKQDGLPGIPEAMVPTVTMMDIINRAIFDPNVSGEKVERLGNMALAFKAQEAKEAYVRALIAMKPLLPIIDRKGRIVIHAKGADKTEANVIQSTPYALWEDIDAAITPILAQHGFVLAFRTGQGAEGRITVTGVLMHEMGHSDEATMPLPLDTSGSKNNVQAAGSSTSYGKRYTATALLNIRTRGEDDDGKKGGDPGTVTDEQAERVLELLTRDKADVGLFCKSMKINSIIELPAARYEEAIVRINTRTQAVKAKEGAKS